MSKFDTPTSPNSAIALIRYRPAMYQGVQPHAGLRTRLRPLDIRFS